MFNPSPIYSARKSSNHRLPQNHKISPDTSQHKRNANIKHKIFEELVPSVLPLLAKHMKLDTLVSWAIPKIYQYQIFKKYIKQEWTEAIFFLLLYKCITANTSVKWQHAAHITDQLTSPSC